MSLSKPSEESPLLGQPNHARSLPANGKIQENGQGGNSISSSSQHEQLSNMSLALIMGSIWVRYAAIFWLGT